MPKIDPLDYPNLPEHESHIGRDTILIVMLLGVLMLVIVLTITSGCVTASKNIMHDALNTPTPTPTPTPAPTFVIETPTPAPTPRLYPMIDNEFLQGVRKINQSFTFYRQNVSGYKDLKAEFKVYKYMIIPDGYTWWAGSLGQYLYNPAPEDMDYLVVFVRGYMDDAYGDPRMPLPDSSHFIAQVGDGLYPEDVTYQKNIRIKELEDIYNYNDDYRVRPYGYEWKYEPKADDREGYEDQYIAPNAGMVAYKRLYLRAGKSNAEDGYILFLIPEHRVDPILVSGSFFGFGDASWLLE